MITSSLRTILSPKLHFLAESWERQKKDLDIATKLVQTMQQERDESNDVFKEAENFVKCMIRHALETPREISESLEKMHLAEQFEFLYGTVEKVTKREGHDREALAKLANSVSGFHAFVTQGEQRYLPLKEGDQGYVEADDFSARLWTTEITVDMESKVEFLADSWGQQRTHLQTYKALEDQRVENNMLHLAQLTGNGGKMDPALKTWLQKGGWTTDFIARMEEEGISTVGHLAIQDVASLEHYSSLKWDNRWTIFSRLQIAHERVAKQFGKVVKTLRDGTRNVLESCACPAMDPTTEEEPQEGAFVCAICKERQKTVMCMPCDHVAMW